MLTTANGSNARRSELIIAKFISPPNIWRAGPRSLVGGAHPPLPPNIRYNSKTFEVDVATNCHSGEHRDEICVRIDSFAG